MFTDVPTVAIQKLTAEGANQILDETWDDEDGYYCKFASAYPLRAH